MLTVCCVKQGTKYGADYARNLYNAVSRHLSVPHDFVCFTDDPVNGVPCRALPEGLNGWWCKLGLFKPSVFESGQVLYFDLDTVIIDKVDDLGHYRGEFAILRDFLRPHGFGSAIMSWPAGTCAKVWSKWVELGQFELQGGDQHWIEMTMPSATILQDEFPGKLVSYKVHCGDGPPAGASVINFHGVPNPHECNGWIEENWKS